MSPIEICLQTEPLILEVLQKIAPLDYSHCYQNMTEIARVACYAEGHLRSFLNNEQYLAGAMVTAISGGELKCVYGNVTEFVRFGTKVTLKRELKNWFLLFAETVRLMPNITEPCIYLTEEQSLIAHKHLNSRYKIIPKMDIVDIAVNKSNDNLICIGE